MKNRLRVLFACVMALFATTQVLAHQQKTAITTVLFNPRTQNIEVMHRFIMHDAEHAVKRIFDKDADILKNKETQLKFSQYVSERFLIANDKGDVLPLSSVGYEVDGKFFWVYQETKQVKDLSTLTVKHDALRDLWPTQTNTVNFEGMGKIKTLTFDESVELLKVEFTDH